MLFLQKIELNSERKTTTSLIKTFDVEPFAVRNKIFRSGFFGAVVQLTYASSDDVVEALTSDVIVTLVETL